LLTELLLVIGFLKLILSRKPVLGFGIEYKALAFFNMGLIAINILVPAIADTFLMQRFYQTTLIILAPMMVLGGKTVLELVRLPAMRKVYSVILVGIVLVPVFLFQSGFVYEITKSPSNSMVLSSYRWSINDTYMQFLDDQIVAGAKWLPNSANLGSPIVITYSDVRSALGVLTSYGMVAREKAYVLKFGNFTPVPIWNIYANSTTFTFLSGMNVITSDEDFSAANITSFVEYQDKVYSNGKTEIYRGAPTWLWDKQ
jgi:uncharacterized membrane protein